MGGSNDDGVLTINIRKGDSVTLNTPDNPHLHGQEGIVVSITEWGAHVATGVGSGKFRALFSEMVKKEPPNSNTITHANTSSRNGEYHNTNHYTTNHKSRSSTLQGYTGDICATCQGVRMRRNGSCLLCEDCGSTSGCS